MAWRFPFTSLHEINLDWILEQVKQFADLIPPMSTAVEEVQSLQGDVEQAVADAQSALENANEAAETAAEALEVAEQAASGTIADGAVTTDKLANNAVTSAKIADRSISGNDIALGTIQTGNLSEGCVTTTQILDGTIAAADLGDGCVTTDKINGEAVTTAKLADTSVTTAKLAAGSVTNAKIEDSAVTNVKIADGAITDTKVEAVSDVSSSFTSNGYFDTNTTVVIAEKLGIWTFSFNLVKSTAASLSDYQTIGVISGWSANRVPLFSLVTATNDTLTGRISQDGSIQVFGVITASKPYRGSFAWII